MIDRKLSPRNEHCIFSFPWWAQTKALVVSDHPVPGRSLMPCSLPLFPWFASLSLPSEGAVLEGSWPLSLLPVGLCVRHGASANVQWSILLSKWTPAVCSRCELFRNECLTSFLEKGGISSPFGILGVLPLIQGALDQASQWISVIKAGSHQCTSIGCLIILCEVLECEIFLVAWKS